MFKTYRFIPILIAIILGIANSAWAIAPSWQSGHSYAVGDFCVTNIGAPATSTFKCTTAHQSTNTNKPANQTFWAQVWPHDPPVSTAGDGPIGDDYGDFSIVLLHQLKFRDANSTNDDAPNFGVYISDNNPNYTLANNKNSANVKVNHWCFLNNYGDANCPSIADGNRYWDWYYSGYTPVVERKGDVNASINCVSYAYHQYKGANTVITNWVDSNSDRTPFVTELTTVAASAKNEYATSAAEDRCDNSSHVWIIKEVATDEECTSATKIEWKNNVSGIYQWSHPNDISNNAPKGSYLDGPKGYFDTYEIRRK